MNVSLSLKQDLLQSFNQRQSEDIIIGNVTYKKPNSTVVVDNVTYLPNRAIPKPETREIGIQCDILESNLNILV